MKHLDTTQERPLALMRRLLRYILKRHKLACLIVVLGILGSALASLSMTLFMQALIDDYILPLTRAAVQDYAPLAQALCKLGAVLLAGVGCAYLYNRIMVNVSQNTMKRLRTELFASMESLPLRYFDTHANLLKTNDLYREIWEAQAQGGGDFDEPGKEA